MFTDSGPALIYALVFAALLLVNQLEGTTPYSIDYCLTCRWPAWRRVAKWGPARALPLPRLSWRAQGYAIAAIVVTLAATPDEGVVNSVAYQHKDHPLPVSPEQQADLVGEKRAQR
jgi:hypothetical protein